MHFLFVFRGKHKNKRLTAAETCDLLKMAVLITCSLMLLPWDTSMMYHVIKSQSVIKLYIFFNMLEVVIKYLLVNCILFVNMFVIFYILRSEIDYFHHLVKTFQMHYFGLLLNLRLAVVNTLGFYHILLLLYFMSVSFKKNNPGILI